MKIDNAVKHQWAIKTIEAFMDKPPENEKEETVFRELVEAVKEYEDENITKFLKAGKPEKYTE